MVSTLRGIDRAWRNKRHVGSEIMSAGTMGVAGDSMDRLAVRHVCVDGTRHARNRAGAAAGESAGSFSSDATRGGFAGSVGI
jgi:hypothetical protein